MFNSLRKPGVTGFDTILLNWREYTHRVKRTMKYAVVFLILVTLVVVIAAGLVVFLSSEGNYGNALKNTASTAAGAAYPINIDEEGVHANSGLFGNVLPDDARRIDEAEAVADSGALVHFDIAIFLLCLFEAFVITLIGMIFSGAYAEVFLSPINPIKFAPYATLHDGMLSFRFWVCTGDSRYLHNVRITLGYTYTDRYRQSDLLFLGDENVKSDPTNIQTEEYARLMGVWRVDVPINSPAGRQLLDAMEEYGDRNPTIKISISAETDSGEVVGKEARYNRLRLLVDHTFVPYHFRADLFDDAEEKTPERERKLNAFANFYRVMPDSDIDTYNSLVDGGDSSTHEQLKELKAKWQEQVKQGWNQVSEQGAEAVQKQKDQRALFLVAPPTQWNPYMTYSDWKLLNNLNHYI